MLKRTLLWAMLAAFVIVLAACGSKSEDTSTNAGGVEETGSAAQEVVIKASNWKFDQPEYKIKKGQPVKITFESTDGVHGIQFTDLNIDKLNSGDSEIVTLNEAGTFEFRCSIMCGTGHAQMIGKLVVE